MPLGDHIHTQKRATAEEEQKNNAKEDTHPSFFFRHLWYRIEHFRFFVCSLIFFERNSFHHRYLLIADDMLKVVFESVNRMDTARRFCHGLRHARSGGGPCNGFFWSDCLCAKGGIKKRCFVLNWFFLRNGIMTLRQFHIREY